MHEDFKNFVQRHWEVGDDWRSSVDQFTEDLKLWNKEVFGNIFYIKESLYRRLDGINAKIASVGISESLEKLRGELWGELEKLLIQEEVMWLQYSRVNWYVDGDRNTKYFHSVANSRRRRNKIEALKLDSGEWTYDEAEIMKLGSQFFENLYTETQIYSGSLVFGCTYPDIDDVNMRTLGRSIEDHEIRRALFDMGPLKAPGPDGFNPLFYQSQWETVGPSVIDLVKKVFNDPMWIRQINATQIVLIPKVEHPETIKDFRPISLCNVVYKIVTKAISNRLKAVMPLVIAPNQCSFVKGRQSSDNIILVQEIIHSMKSLKKKKGFMAIKIDLEKAYDRVRWSFISDCLRELKIPDYLLRVIQACISTSQMQINWNGKVTNTFCPSRGVRQGDPISPYLFVIMMERLGHLIQTAVDEGDWKPFRLSKRGTPVSHIFFADDLILFAEADLDHAGVVKAVLDDFCDISGQKVNPGKSRIYFSRNVNHIRCKEISEFLNFTPTSNLGKYLGMPILHERSSKATYNFLLNKMDARLANWKSNMLSMAARHTLVSSVMSAMPSYAMQTVPLPLGTCDEIDKRCRNFLWGSSSVCRKPHLVSWDLVCARKENGGLGLRKARHQNQAFMMKLGWNMIIRQDSLWVRFLREKYKAGNDIIPKIEKRRSESSTWRGIRNNWEKVNDSITWRVANGENISFWNDVWVPHLDKLQNLVTRELPRDASVWRVADCITPSGQWDMSKFDHLLPGHVCTAIRRVNIRQLNGEDFPAWRWSSDGNFSISSAYKFMVGIPRAHTKYRWKCVWKMKVPQRYRTFLWLCFHGRLMTNMERFHRGSHPTGNCEVCHNARESILHVLRDCPTISEFWNSFLSPGWRDLFFGILDRNDWLAWCMERKEVVQGFEFRLWFTVLCRYIWLARNDRCFNNNTWSTNAILARARACLTWGNTSLCKNHIEKESCTLWKTPPPGWVKINTDGSRSDNLGMCTCGGVLRDQNGEFLLGFMYRIGQGTVVSAEAWGVLWGLKISWDRGYRQILIESDCSEVMELIQSTVSQEHPDFHLIMEIRALLDRDWEVEMLHCNRDANTVADAMAKEAWNMPIDLHITESPPFVITSLLLTDHYSSRSYVDSGG